MLCALSGTFRECGEQIIELRSWLIRMRADSVQGVLKGVFKGSIGRGPGDKTCLRRLLPQIGLKGWNSRSRPVGVWYIKNVRNAAHRSFIDEDGIAAVPAELLPEKFQDRVLDKAAGEHYFG